MIRLTVTVAAIAVAALSMGQGMQMARYGGPTYTGQPALNVTASLIKAGGGASHFSAAKALTSMVGKKTTGAEVEKLTKQYGKERVGKWIAIFDYAVDDAIKIATKAGVKLPAASLHGTKLAATIVQAAMDKDGTIYTELMLDKALSHGIHDQVMDDIDKKFNGDDDLDYHRITNQALFDLATAFKVPGVKLAKLH